MLQNCHALVKLKCTENKSILIEKKVWVCLLKIFVKVHNFSNSGEIH